MSSQYSSPHAFFMTKTSEGTSNAEKTVKQRQQFRSCPEVLTRRVTGRSVGNAPANSLYSMTIANPTPRTPSPERPPVQQPCYPRNNDQHEDRVAALRSQSSSFYPSSVNAETDLTSPQVRLQYRALPGTNGRRRMSTPAIPSDYSARGWEQHAIRGAPQNRAVVILQGEIEDQLMEDLKTDLQQKGFRDPNILHRRYGKISKLELESNAASLVDGLTPSSNLLLMICESSYGHIELTEGFLDERIYAPVAKYNQKKDKEFSANRAKSNVIEFDSRRFEGVTLHVIIDGVNAHPLKHILRLNLSETQNDVKSEWKTHNMDQDSNRNILDGQMGHGDVVQFWVSRDMHGYDPLLLLKAMLHICLEEPELPYKIFLLRLRTILHKPLERSFCLNSIGQGNCRKGVRSLSVFAVTTCVSLVKHLVSHVSKRALENQTRQTKQDIYDGNCVLSSIDKFDPNLSLKLNWKY